MGNYTDPDSWQKKAIKPPVEGDIVHIENLYQGKYQITTVVERTIGYLPESDNWLVEVFLGITRRTRREDSLAPNSQVIIKKAGNDWDLVR